MGDPLAKYTPYLPASTRSVSPLKLIIIMVGLPARGKLYLSKQLAQHLQQQQLATEIFNVGNTRRAEDGGAHDASFFSAANAANVRRRDQYALDTLAELLDWLYRDPVDRVAIFDATNSTVIRRAALLQQISAYDATMTYHRDTETLFLENIVDDEHIIHNNIMSKLALSPDYNGVMAKPAPLVAPVGQSAALLDPHQRAAYADFQNRLANYENVYEPIDIEELATLKNGRTHNNIKMIKLYNYGGTFVKAGDILLFNMMTSAQLLSSGQKQLQSPGDYVSKILEFLLGYRYEYATPPQGEVKSARIQYHCVLCK